MNPLTQIKNTQKASKYEIAAGLSEAASWHAKFKHSAYVFAGGLPYELTEGDLLAVFAQYGEIVDVNLVRCSCICCNAHHLAAHVQALRVGKQQARSNSSWPAFTLANQQHMVRLWLKCLVLTCRT